jgi:hypothetical protein
MGSGSWQRARIMITVKTYPERSAKYHETSRVAGIRLDQGTPQHVRLFPLPFRLLNEESQFAKYSIVEVDVQRHHGDRRPESLRPNLQTQGHRAPRDSGRLARTLLACAAPCGAVPVLHKTGPGASGDVARCLPPIGVHRLPLGSC